MLSICREAEPGGLLMAEDGGLCVGYVFAPRSPAHVFALGARRCRHLWMLFQGLRGRYGVSWAESFAGLRAYGHMWQEAALSSRPDEGRIFSLGVHPRHRGRGIGSELTRRALAYLRAQGATAARLEVREENLVARRLYEKLGFSEQDGLSDAMGRWIVMRKALTPDGSEP